MSALYHGDCLDYLLHCEHQRFMFADVFDNIGLAYQGYKDQMPSGEYQGFVQQLLARALRKCDIFWFTYNQIHDFWIKAFVNRLCADSGHDVRQIVWAFTFGQYNDNDFTSCYRPFLVFTRGVTLNYDGIRTVSERMRLGDARAAGLRIPGDVWDFPRVTGNSPERRAWHVTQLPEALVQRILILSCMTTNMGRTTVIPRAVANDLFLGSGTTAVVAQRLGIPWIGVEKSDFYIQELQNLLKTSVIKL